MLTRYADVDIKEYRKSEGQSAPKLEAAIGGIL